MSLEEMRIDCAMKQKKGLHFILASVLIWAGVLIIQLSNLPMLTKNLYTFCCTAPLLPLAYLISLVIKVDFQNKGNTLTNLGVLFSVNQMLYLLIAMWIYPTIPDKMLMVLAIIFGAHLLPFGWLYNSKSYYALSIVIPITALIIGCNFEPAVIAITMLCFELLFSILLIYEMKHS
ncbi:MAG: putative rane protein [Herbinix sp.]|jgi:hypothetical protein|nr:putative rane protein [Herbinix sp.]